ncbi:hypothetical protein JB92DRAFT_1574693 [Gautieria morchelliformis]|nr:hypothetical protein JB92DRAFT_1574693 [Gautieria morchelliformis]
MSLTRRFPEAGPHVHPAHDECARPMRCARVFARAAAGARVWDPLPYPYPPRPRIPRSRRRSPRTERPAQPRRAQCQRARHPRPVPPRAPTRPRPAAPHVPRGPCSRCRCRPLRGRRAVLRAAGRERRGRTRRQRARGRGCRHHLLHRQGRQGRPRRMGNRVGSVSLDTRACPADRHACAGEGAKTVINHNPLPDMTHDEFVARLGPVLAPENYAPSSPPLPPVSPPHLPTLASPAGAPCPQCSGPGMPPFDWMHFEGRAAQTTLANITGLDGLARERGWRARCVFSLGVTRAGVEQLIQHADVVFFS